MLIKPRRTEAEEEVLKIFGCLPHDQFRVNHHRHPHVWWILDRSLRSWFIYELAENFNKQLSRVVMGCPAIWVAERRDNVRDQPTVAMLIRSTQSLIVADFHWNDERLLALRYIRPGDIPESLFRPIYSLKYQVVHLRPACQQIPYDDCEDD